MRALERGLAALALFAALCALSGAPGEAAEASPDKVAAMEKIAFLVGTWEGEGWMATGPDQRAHFKSREVVELRLQGTLMVIEGLHTARGGDDEPPQVVHHAMALVSPREEGGYDFRSWVVGRGGGEFEGRYEDGAFIWGMETPRGKMRYTIRLDDEGRWSEVGEFQADDGSWRPFFGMTLSKVE